MSNYLHVDDVNVHDVIRKKRRQLIPWPESCPETLRSCIKLAFWVWFCTTITLLALVKLD